MRDICDDLRERIAAIDGELMPLKSRVKQLEMKRFNISRLLQSESGGTPSIGRAELIPGSLPHDAAAVIRNAGRPLHVKEIAQHMGQSGDSRVLKSITTQLSKYAQDVRVFKRTSPTTFGLLDEDESTALADEKPERPTLCSEPR
jgi:hypothetical protein